MDAGFFACPIATSTATKDKDQSIQVLAWNATCSRPRKITGVWQTVRRQLSIIICCALQAHLGNIKSLKRHPRPLVLLTPKALLRHPLASAQLEDLTNGSFQPVIDDARAHERADQIRRVVLCSGKIAIDLLAHESRAHNEDIAIVRVEML